MTIRLARAALVLPAFLLLPARSDAQSSARDSVVSVVQRLFDGMRTRDTALIRAAFDSSAHLISVPGSPTDLPRPRTPTAFIAQFATGAPAAVWDERIFDPEVRVDGPVAQVWTYYTFHIDATFSHCGTDAINLMRRGNQWKIVSMIWTVRRDPCTRKE